MNVWLSDHATRPQSMCFPRPYSFCSKAVGIIGSLGYENPQAMEVQLERGWEPWHLGACGLILSLLTLMTSEQYLAVSSSYLQ
jgi:hypothetical protein